MFFYIRHTWKARTLDNAETHYTKSKDLLKKGLPLLIMSTGGVLLSWTDILVLGIFESEASVGIYSVASKVALVTSLILVAINSIVAPKFSYLYSTGNIYELRKLANQTTRLMLILTLPPSLIFILYPEAILNIFGLQFKEGATTLVILTIGQFVSVACGAVGYMLVMTGNEKTLRNIMITTAFINIVLSIFLVTFFGILGVAIATAISVITWNVLALLKVKKKLGFWMLG